jgi:hypothetical protein
VFCFVHNFDGRADLLRCDSEGRLFWYDLCSVCRMFHSKGKLQIGAGQYCYWDSILVMVVL